MCIVAGHIVLFVIYTASALSYALKGELFPLYCWMLFQIAVKMLFKGVNHVK